MPRCGRHGGRLPRLRRGALASAGPQAPPAWQKNPTPSRRFRREAQTAARLNHPAIVHVYDIVETETGDWIVMELVEGPPLLQKIRDGSL